MIERATFDAMPLHAVGYQEGGSLQPDYEETLAAILRDGLSRGSLRGAPDRGPILARLGADWELPGVRYMDEGDAYLLLDCPVVHRVGIDCALGDRIPADRIVAVIRPRRGETLWAAYARLYTSPENPPPAV